MIAGGASQSTLEPQAGMKEDIAVNVITYLIIKALEIIFGSSKKKDDKSPEKSYQSRSLLS